jgi:hypothetical protein
MGSRIFPKNSLGTPALSIHASTFPELLQMVVVVVNCPYFLAQTLIL